MNKIKFKKKKSNLQVNNIVCSVCEKIISAQINYYGIERIYWQYCHLCLGQGG